MKNIKAITLLVICLAFGLWPVHSQITTLTTNNKIFRSTTVSNVINRIQIVDNSGKTELFYVFENACKHLNNKFVETKTNGYSVVQAFIYIGKKAPGLEFRFYGDVGEPSYMVKCGMDGRIKDCRKYDTGHDVFIDTQEKNK